MVHVWSARLDLPGWPAAELLPPPDRDRAARLGDAERRRRWTAARWALRGVLARYLGQPAAEIRLAGERGAKPRLSGGAAALRFNLSHSADLALVAVAWGREVGVDVERVDLGRDVTRLASRLLDRGASEAVLRSPAASRALAFHRAWVRREAVAKLAGGGLAAPPPRLAAAVSALEVGPSFAAALAVCGDRAPSIERFAIEPGQLSPPQPRH